MRFCVLASGSKGNAIWVETSQAAVLVDNGLSGKELKKRLAAARLDPGRLTAILLSHEHHDHASGVGIAARAFNAPVFVSQRTYDRTRLGKIDRHTLAGGKPLKFGNLKIHPFALSHDAADPMGFVFENQHTRLGLATDLGVATKLVQARLAGCQALIVEANHDHQMLMDGPYPWPLKQRVRGRTGHLSNDDTAGLLQTLDHPELHTVVLAHLSEVNNDPERARNRVHEALPDHPFKIILAQQNRPTPIITL